MRHSSFDKWLLTIALLVVITGAVWHFVDSNRAVPEQKPTRREPIFPQSDDFHPYYIASVPRPTNGEPDQAAGPEKLPREKVEAWLAKHHRNAMSLLTAFRALNDTNYLNEAATNSPSNPRVELAVLVHEEFPADRRKWLDLLKASSPSNSLANYLSAQDYFNNGNTDAGIRELLVATGKTQFDTYTTQNILDSEDLYSSSGTSPGMPARWAANRDITLENNPELATFKRLAQGISDAQQQYLSSGDNSSVANLAQMGMQFGNQIVSGDSGKYLNNQLVGLVIESVVLRQLNPNTSYVFLGGQTPSRVMEENKQQMLATLQIVPVFANIIPNLTDAEIAEYYNRATIYGQVEAMKWVIQQHPPGNL